MFGNDFYGIKLGKPLSRVMDTQEWVGSQLDKLHAESKGNVYLSRIPEIPRRLDTPPFGWYITDLYYSDEDSTNTIFRCYYPNTSPAPIAIGINWDTLQGRLAGSFRYKPLHGDQYYHLIDDKFHTVEVSGYNAQVLDFNYPSETINFGIKVAEKHQCLIVTFQLLEFQF